MSGKRHRVPEKQVVWHFHDPEVLLREEGARGDVVFESSEASRIVASRPPLLPRVRQRRARAPVDATSMALPFGARRLAEGLLCWTCGQALSEADLVSVGPGMAACPGCGARLPFV